VIQGRGSFAQAVVDDGGIDVGEGGRGCRDGALILVHVHKSLPACGTHTLWKEGRGHWRCFFC